MLGLSQCGNYTAGIKALAGLFPASTRARAGGFFNAGAQFGSVIAPPIVVFLITVHVRLADGVRPPGAGRVDLAHPVVRDIPGQAHDHGHLASSPPRPRPRRRRRVSLAEMMTNRKVLGLFLIRVFTGPITTFYWTWLPLYLRTSVENGGRGMSFLAIGFFASVPNLIGMSGNVVGGLLTDQLVKSTGSVDRGRKIAFTCAFLLGALSMSLPFVRNDLLAVLLMGLALFGNQWVAATYIGTVGDVVPQQLAGRVNGIAGFGDNGAALLAVLYTGVIADRYGWTPVFIGAGMVPFFAMASLFLVLRRIEPAVFRTGRA